MIENVERDEKRVRTVTFREAVRKWLKICVDILYRFGSLLEHRYVFLHVVRCRGISQWYACSPDSMHDALGLEPRTCHL